MHRKGARIVTGTPPAEQDVQFGAIADAQYVKYDAATQKLVGGTPAGGAGDVTGPASATDNAIARYDLTTGKLIQNSVVIVSDAGALTGVTTINGFTPGPPGTGDVVGPASSTDTAIPTFDGTTGKLLRNSVVTISNDAFGDITTSAGAFLNGRQISKLPNGPTLAPTTNTIVLWDTVGLPYSTKGSPLVVDTATGNMTGVGTVNGVTVTKYQLGAELSALVDLTTGTTLQAVTGLSIALPRAGTYFVRAVLNVVAVTGAVTAAWAINASANFTRCSLSAMSLTTASAFAAEIQTTNLAVAGTGVASGSHAITTLLPTYLDGSVTVSGAATLQVLASRSANTLRIGAGSCLQIREN